MLLQKLRREMSRSELTANNLDPQNEMSLNANVGSMRNLSANVASPRRPATAAAPDDFFRSKSSTQLIRSGRSSRRNSNISAVEEYNDAGY